MSSARFSSSRFSLLLLAPLAATACDSEPEGRGRDGHGVAAPVYRVDDATRDGARGAGSDSPVAKSTGRFIVVLKEEEVAGSSMGTMMGRFSDVRVEETIDTPAVHGFTAPLTDDEIEELRYEPEVAFIEEEQIFTAIAATNLWGLDRIDQASLPLNGDYTVQANGTGVDAYIVDTGIRSSHSQFSGRIGSGYDAVGGGTEDCNGHGTHVAGTVGGSSYGVATNVTLHAVRVLGCGGSGSTTGIINALGWIEGDAAGSAAVVNMSLGGGTSSALDNAVASLVNSGVTVVVAAGNENQNACNVSPARESSAITVGSTTSSDNRSNFSNWGNCVDVFAPGSNITSAWHTGSNASNTISGTSMASPHAAGVAALYLQGNPGASPAAVANAMLSNATSGVVSGANGSPNLLVNTDFIGGDGGGDPPPPPPPPPAGCSEASCGGQSPDGCWCDETCAQYGDCCANYEDVCAEPPPLDPSGCEANAACGGQSPSGCWCDGQCAEYGDCCSDGPC